MGFFRTILAGAVLAGILAGAALTGLQTLKVYPLIFAAEKLENKGEDHAAHTHPAPGHDSEAEAWMPADGVERLLYSLLSNLLIGISFGLVLAAIFALREVVDWRQGAAWGLGGFIAVNFAPALGMPPELPGMPAGDLLARQTWWLATALLTAFGIALIFLGQRLIWRAPGVVLIALPHIYGAPHPAVWDSDVPAVLAAEFATASLASNLIFWVVLGMLAAETLARLNRNGGARLA